MKRYSIVLSLTGAILASSCNDSTVGPASPGTGVTVSINNPTATEPTGGPTSGVAIFIVSLNRTSTERVTFDWATEPSTAGEDDYRSESGVDTIPAGSLSKAINIVILSDVRIEPDETFELVLTNLTGATFADSIGTATITANNPGPAPDFSPDAPPTISRKQGRTNSLET